MTDTSIAAIQQMEQIRRDRPEINESDHNKVNQFLGIIAFFELKLKQGALTNIANIFEELGIIAKLYSDLSPGARKVVQYYINATSKLKLISSSTIGEVWPLQQWYKQLIIGGITIARKPKIIAFPVRGGAVYEMAYANGKGTGNKMVSFNTEINQKAEYVTGNLMTQSITSRFDESLGCLESLFFEITLKPNRDALKDPHVRETYYALSQQGMETIDTKGSLHYGWAKADWQQWLAFVITGRDPYEKLTPSESCMIVAFLGINAVQVDPLMKTVTNNFAVFESTWGINLKSALLRSTETPELDAHDRSGEALILSCYDEDGNPKPYEVIREKIKSHIGDFADSGVVGAHVVAAHDTPRGTLISEVNAETVFHFENS